jgi:vacuolar-type H+-ATPase subunit D/Vma8
MSLGGIIQRTCEILMRTSWAASENMKRLMGDTTRGIVDRILEVVRRIEDHQKEVGEEVEEGAEVAEAVVVTSLIKVTRWP